MTMIQLIACIGMIAGLFMVLGISPAEMSDSIFSRLTAAPGSIQENVIRPAFLCSGHLFIPVKRERLDDWTDYGLPDTPYIRFEHRCAEKRMNRFSQSAQNSAAPGIAANSKNKS